MWEGRKGRSLIQYYLGQGIRAQCTVCSKGFRPNLKSFCVFFFFFEKDAVSYIIKSVLRSNITLWNLNDLHSKKSIPAWEGYDEIDNLF